MELKHFVSVVFKDCSQSARVEVSVQEKSSRKSVKVTIDNHEYELEVPSSSGNQQAVIKVNGEEKSYMKKQVHEKRKEVEVYPLESFISEFGGALGLFIGFSFMMIWDLIEMLLTISIETFPIK